MRFPDKPTAPSQWNVIAWTSITILLAVAVVSFYFASTAPDGKAEEAAELQGYGLVFLGLAAALYCVKRLVQWLSR